MSDAIHLSETRKYIRLFQMQLHGVLEDMAKPAEDLSDIFSTSLMKLHDIQNLINNDESLNNAELSKNINEVIAELFECVSCMQFVDAKRQRIEHVADGLSYIIENNSANNAMKYDWETINNMVVDQYKMKSERKIYEDYLTEYGSYEHDNLQHEVN